MLRTQNKEVTQLYNTDYTQKCKLISKFNVHWVVPPTEWKNISGGAGTVNWGGRPPNPPVIPTLHFSVSDLLLRQTRYTVVCATPLAGWVVGYRQPLNIQLDFHV